MCDCAARCFTVLDLKSYLKTRATEALNLLSPGATNEQKALAVKNAINITTHSIDIYSELQKSLKNEQDAIIKNIQALMKVHNR